MQLARRAPNAYTASFDLVEKNRDVIDHSRDSFMISMHQQLLVDLSKKWHISIPLLDYNLARLRRCAKLCLEQLQQRARQEQLQLLARLPVTATFSVEELPLALEFYLQMDGQHRCFCGMDMPFFPFECSRSILLENMLVS